jgi:putative transposase
MEEDTVLALPRPGSGVTDDPLLAVPREGARRMLAQAIEAEVEAFPGFPAAHAGLAGEQGRRRLVRDGHAPERRLQTGIGPLEVRRPKLRDRGGVADGEPIRFTSAVLPAYLRRTRNIEELLPWLYLKGASTGRFAEALTALLGPEAPGPSPATVRRLTEGWRDEHERWQERDLSARRYVHLWADGVYLTPRLEHERQCLLVLIGADASGRKELLAVEDGFRESAQSWRELLLRLRDENGLALDPELATGDGALGSWQALHEVWPKTKRQRCRVRKTANVLDKLPASLQGKAKQDLHAIHEAANRKEAERALDRFVAKCGAKHDKAVACLSKDRESLPARLPRLPRRALEARPDERPDREHLRDRPAADRQDQGLPVTPDRARRGLQARQVRRAAPAPAGRLGAPRPGDRGRALPRRRTRSRGRGPGRRLIPNTKIDHSPGSSSATACGPRPKTLATRVTSGRDDRPRADHSGGWVARLLDRARSAQVLTQCLPATARVAAAAAGSFGVRRRLQRINDGDGLHRSCATEGGPGLAGKGV